MAEAKISELERKRDRSVLIVVVATIAICLLAALIFGKRKRTEPTEEQKEAAALAVKSQREKIIQDCLPLIPKCQAMSPGQPSVANYEHYGPIKRKGAVLLADVRDKPADGNWIEYTCGDPHYGLRVQGAYIVDTSGKSDAATRAKGNEPEITVLLITRTIDVGQAPGQATFYDYTVEVCAVYWPALKPAGRSIVRYEQQTQVLGRTSNRGGAWPIEWGAVGGWAN